MADAPSNQASGAPPETSFSSPARHQITKWASVGGTLAPGILLLALIKIYAVNFPFWDDWAYVFGNIRFMDGGIDWTYLFARQGSHIVAIPKLLYWVNYSFGPGDLRAAIWLNACLMLLIYLGLVLLIKRTAPPDSPTGLFYMLAAWASFSLCQWLLVFSAWGPSWLLLPLFLRFGMLLADIPMKPVTLTIWLAVFASAATMTLAAGYSLWLVFPLYLFLRRRISLKRPSLADLTSPAIWTSGALLCLLLLLRGYGAENRFEQEINFVAPSGDAQFSPLSWALTNPGKAAMFFTILLGSPAGHWTHGFDEPLSGYLNLFGSHLAGLYSVFLFALTLHYSYRRRHDQTLVPGLAPWITIALMELVISGLITMGRAGGYTFDRALSSHYGMIGLQFQFAVYFGAHLIWRDLKNRQLLSPAKLSLSYRIGLKTLPAATIVLILVHLAGQPAMFGSLATHSRAQQFRQDALRFVEVMPPRSWPPILRTVELKRLREFREHGALMVNGKDDILSTLEKLSLTQVPATHPHQATITLSLEPELTVSGVLESTYASAIPPTVFLESRNPSRAPCLLPVSVHRDGDQLTLSSWWRIYTYPTNGIERGYLFDRDRGQLLPLRLQGNGTNRPIQ